MINLDTQFSNIIDKYNKIEQKLNSMENTNSENLDEDEDIIDVDFSKTN